MAARRSELREPARSLTALLARTVSFAAVFGFAIGSAHSELYALRNLVKFPLLILATTLLCAISNHVTARMLGARVGFASVQHLVLRFYHDTTLLLASLAPITLFVGYVMRASDDGRLGEYDSFLALHMALVAIAGALALLRQSRLAFEDLRLPIGTARATTIAWLAISLAVGGQLAFLMRPFFGIPRTRGGHPPWFLGTTPDLRGASNFYEMVWQTLSRPGLPTD